MNGATKKRKGHHWVSVARVSYRGRQLQTIAVCYGPSVPHCLSIILKHVFISSWAPFPCKLVFKSEFYP